jgi:uncharacterized membrane protein
VFVGVSAVRLAPCAGGHFTPYCEYYLPRPGIFVHMAGGLLAVIVGLVQVGLGVTGRTGALHRWLGRVYLVVVALACAGGLFLLQTLEPPYSPHYRIGLTCGIVVWGLATAWAYGAALRRAYAAHGRWMLRSFVTSQLFVVFRLVWWPVRLLAHDWFVLHQVPLEGALAWLAWCVPLLVLEGILLTSGRASRRLGWQVDAVGVDRRERSMLRRSAR